MISKLKKFFDQNLSVTETELPEHKLKLATAALLIEIMHQDHTVQPEEQQAVKKALMGEFQLTDHETLELFELAKKHAKQATDLYQFTSLINQQYSQKQKIHLIELLWQIAFSDNQLDSFEEHMIRRVADLIYVSHKDFIQTKHRVQEQLD